MTPREETKAEENEEETMLEDEEEAVPAAVSQPRAENIGADVAPVASFAPRFTTPYFVMSPGLNSAMRSLTFGTFPHSFGYRPRMPQPQGTQFVVIEDSNLFSI